MPTKHNKKRYQAHQKPRKLLVLNGTTYLMYRDEELYQKPIAGEVMFYPSCDVLHTIRQGDYDATGAAGYFKLDVFDGKQWQPLLLNDIFADRINHFSKYECPADTFVLCEEVVKKLAGKAVQRTYREHYELAED